MAVEFKYKFVASGHRWAVAIGRFIRAPWVRAVEVDALWRRVRALEKECNELRQSSLKAEAELLEKQQTIGALVQWIKITHRLDVPPQAGTIRKLLDEAQSKPSP